MNHKIYVGDVLQVLKKLPSESVNLIVTSPPYWGLRDYGVKEQIGLEPTLNEYLDKMLQITAELKRVLRKDGIMFWNHGDNYSTGNAHSDWKVKAQGPSFWHSSPHRCRCVQPCHPVHE